MKRMPRAEAARYEEHLLVCPQCRKALIRFEVFVAALRGAVEEFEREDRAASASC